MIQSTDLIAAFPEFGNTTLYPLDTINFWIGQGYVQLDSVRFGSQLDFGVMLWTGHNVVLAARDAVANARGVVAGAPTGPIVSKAIDKISVGYSTSTSIEGAGIWNATTYGQRFYKLLKGLAAGGLYVPGRSRTFAPYGR